MQKISVVILVVGILMATACNKKKQLTEADNTEKGDAAVTVVNRMNDSVYLTISGHDIVTGTQPHIITKGIAAADSFVFTPGMLKSGFRYEYEWHSTKYRAGSWMMTNDKGRPAELFFNYYLSGNDTSVHLQSPERDDLLICLDGDGISTTWQTTDAFDANGISVWAGLTDAQRKHSFTISRFHTIKHSFTDAANKQVTTNLAFAMDMSQPRTWLSVAYVTDSFVLANNLSPVASLNTGNRQELFYVRTGLNASGAVVYKTPYYKLVRQSVER